LAAGQLTAALVQAEQPKGEDVGRGVDCGHRHARTLPVGYERNVGIALGTLGLPWARRDCHGHAGIAIEGEAAGSQACAAPKRTGVRHDVGEWRGGVWWCGRAPPSAGVSRPIPTTGERCRRAVPLCARRALRWWAATAEESGAPTSPRRVSARRVSARRHWPPRLPRHRHRRGVQARRHTGVARGVSCRPLCGTSRGNTVQRMTTASWGARSGWGQSRWQAR